MILATLKATVLPEPSPDPRIDIAIVHDDTRLAVEVLPDAQAQAQILPGSSTAIGGGSGAGGGGQPGVTTVPTQMVGVEVDGFGPTIRLDNILTAGIELVGGLS